MTHPNSNTRCRCGHAGMVHKSFVGECDHKNCCTLFRNPAYKKCLCGHYRENHVKDEKCVTEVIVHHECRAFQCGCKFYEYNEDEKSDRKASEVIIDMTDPTLDDPEYDECICGHFRVSHGSNERFCRHCKCGKFIKIKFGETGEVMEAIEKDKLLHGGEDLHPKIDHPEHYGGDTIYEAIKVIMAWGLGFNLGNAAKYICRAGKKDGETKLHDLRKAKFYIEYEIAEMTNPMIAMTVRRSDPQEIEDV